MNIIVCFKQVNDPEAPVNSFKIDPDSRTVLPPSGIPPVISTFDEYAIEAALRLKEKHDAKITAVCLGMNLMLDVVKKPLSMGADELILLEDPAYVDGDSWSTAYALSAAIKKIGEYDMVLCGRQAADWDSGQVGLGIAEMLDLPSISLARKVDVIDGKVLVERVIPDGFELVEASLPVLITISNEHPAPRYPNVKGTLMARKKVPVVWKPGDIGIDSTKIGAKGRKAKLIKLFQPVREGTCEMVDGDSPEEAATKLADKLRENKVL